MRETIKKYYCSKNVCIIGFLKDDIIKNNDKALRYLGYIIKNLIDIDGINELLEDIAQIDSSRAEGERIYHNSLMELHAICFVHKNLKIQILEVESNTNKVLSPFREGNKSCDIKAKDSGIDYYFESKDASSEITTSYKDENGVIHFTPMLKDKIRNWINEKSKDADYKGANYLICRVPVWGDNPEKEFYNEWIKDIFQIENKLSKQEFRISLPVSLSSNFNGIYIIKEFGYLKLTVSFTS